MDQEIKIVEPVVAVTGSESAISEPELESQGVLLIENNLITGYTPDEAT